MTLNSSSIIFPFFSSLYCKTEWENCLHVSSHPCLFYSSIHNNQACSSPFHWICSCQVHNHFTKPNTVANSKPLRYWTFSNILHTSSLLSSCISFTWLWNTVLLQPPNAIPFADLLSSIPLNLVALELDSDVYSESVTHFSKFKTYLLNCLFSLLFWYASASKQIL